MPRSLLVLASVCPALLLCSRRIRSASHGSTTLAILQADPSSMHQRMRTVICIAGAAPEKAERASFVQEWSSSSVSVSQNFTV